MSYRLTTKAQEGLLRVADHVYGRFGPEVAEHVLDRLEEAFGMLAASPEAGHVRQDITDDPDVRFWPVGPTLIAYRAQAAHVEILLVERGELDWEALMERWLGGED